MWKPYKNVSEALIPQAEVVADRFHVMKQVNEELDGARKKIKKAAEASKNNSEKARILSGIKKRALLNYGMIRAKIREGTRK